MKNFTTNRKNENITFVNFDNGTFARVEMKKFRETLNSENYELIKVTGNYDNKKYSFIVNRFGGVEVFEISNKKMTNEILNHKVFGKCKLISRNNNGSIKVLTDKGEKTVIEQFFMNGIIN